MDTIRLAGGKIVEEWTQMDFLGFFEQIGVSSPLAEANKKQVRRYMEEIWNQGNLALIDELLSEDSVFHGPSLPKLQGRDARKQFIASSRGGSPDVHFTIEEMIAEGSNVVMRWSSNQTHRGEFLGIAPTGKQFSGNGTTTCRIVEGMITEEFVQFDALGVMQQLGVVPALGLSAEAGH